MNGTIRRDKFLTELHFLIASWVAVLTFSLFRHTITGWRILRIGGGNWRLEMDVGRKSKKIVNLSDLAFERDKQKAKEELTAYFEKKNRQVKAAQLVSAVKSSVRKRLFTVAEAKKLTEYLARKFDIRRPAIQYAQAGYLSPRVIVVKDSAKQEGRLQFKRKNKTSEDVFLQLFLRLQAAVQDNLLDYNGARVLVRETVEYYPVTQDKLRR